MDDQSRDQPESLAVLVTCAACAKPITIVLSDGPNGPVDPDRAVAQPEAGGPPAARESKWHCPWCKAANTGVFPGRIVFTFKGHRTQ